MTTTVYIDGSASGNGKTDCKAGYGVYFGEDDERNESGRIIGSKQTNNVAELTAFIRAVEIVKDDIEIYTDSEYVIKCITTHGDKMQKINWEKDIPNKEFVKKAYDLYKSCKNIKVHHVKAHTGGDDEFSRGNNEADKLATQSIGNKQSTIIILDISFEDKNTAKILGAKWDIAKKHWYCDSKDIEMENVKKLIELSNANDNKTYVKITYEKKDKAKALGCKWDAKKKSWYYTNDMNEATKQKIIDLSNYVSKIQF